ncbi:hypothetical protein [Halomarina pelagica]|uniref:hypothetical protein n=1 Tax=Halomarina pelagica TaxID=2961599 RepID=UPI0020C3041A|nr:hypothetical protein [Halomarina sp. BND7]
MRDERARDEPYDREGDESPGDEPRSRFPYPAISWGWPPAFFGDDRAYTDREGDGETVGRDDDGGWLDEGAISLVLVVGLALFLFPEPATSLVGIALMGIGVVAWVIDAIG